MPISRFVAALVMLAAVPAYADDNADNNGIFGYAITQRWLQAAGAAADEAVTHEVCGWGFIDLLAPLLVEARRQGVAPELWDALARRYEDAARERRRNEAVLTAHGANAPPQRLTGLYATGGCGDAVRACIEGRAAAGVE